MNRVSMRKGLAVLVAGGCLALAGCTAVQRWGELVRPAGEREPDAAGILTECRSTASLPREEQDKLLKKWRSDVALEKTTGSLFNFACLALQPQRSRQERARARDMLRDYQRREGTQEDLAALAWLLEGLAERQLVTEQKLEEERKRADSLAGKLKALEDIEKIIRQREEGAMVSPGG